MDNFNNFENPNTVTKDEWDEIVKSGKLDIFSEGQASAVIVGLGNLIKKGETNELSSEEQIQVEEGKAEIANLIKYTVIDKVNHRLVKSVFYAQEKQVSWEDTLEKSESGESIKKGVFLDTELNRSLNRVGVELIKGKKVEPEKEEEESKPEFDTEMYKSASESAMSKMDKKEIFKALKAKYPDGDKDVMKACANKAYGDMAKSYMEKADVEIDFDDDDDEKEEETEKGKKK